MTGSGKPLTSVTIDLAQVTDETRMLLLCGRMHIEIAISVEQPKKAMPVANLGTAKKPVKLKAKKPTLETIGLPHEIRDVLTRCKIFTIEELLKKSWDEIAKSVLNMSLSRRVLYNALYASGLKLKGDFI